MAQNNVIVTAGLPPTQTEHVHLTTHTNPGELVQLAKGTVNGEDVVGVVNMAEDAIVGLGIVNYPSTTGLGNSWKDINKTVWDDDVYEINDQVPVIWPTNGLEVNTMGPTSTTFAKGDYIGSNGQGQIKVASGAETAIGICLEDVEITDTNMLVKWKVIR